MEVVPPLHGVQYGAPEVFEKVLTPHVTHDSWPVSLFAVPGMQGRQNGWPAEPWYLPAGHGVHWFWPALDCLEPAGQSSHRIAAASSGFAVYFPAEHGEQKEAPVSPLVSCPVGHAAQSLVVSWVSAGASVPNPLYVLTGQREQARLPSSTAICPAPHT